MQKPLRLAIHGAAGRMGQRLVALIATNPEMQLVAAIESNAHPKQGQDAGMVAGVGGTGVLLSDAWNAEAQVAIDFSTPAGTRSALAACEKFELPLVIATTGLSKEDLDSVRAASKKIPILWSPSMSLAVNLAMKLSAVAAGALKDHPSGADVEILERHHRFKEDSPSGTALKFGAIIKEIMGQTAERHGREGRPGERPHGEIGYHAIRAGDNPGEHTILFGLLGESLEINVRATSRDCYAQGALAAAKFLAGQPAGLYGMEHVLGLG